MFGACGVGSVGKGRNLIYVNLLLILSSYSYRANGRVATSKLRQGSFRARIGKRRASLFALDGGRKVRIYVAGCKTQIISVLIPSEGKGQRSIIYKFSAVARCVRRQRGFNSAIKHCVKHVLGTHFALSKMRCGLIPGGKGSKRVSRKKGPNFTSEV